ncbi:MAG: sugar phosphate isomerase/epimerase [Rhodothermaceae bacterium]|nr:sugar phosphate isomerase/epimerase [Bacteroidota bacterium]MXW14196.1 sugar phosphate isomerase/epimerase [Rhodothermaceae bacterium]MXZ17478.1 sugar phosphate isomerase/epimerase [Rhodothermaceae bacterium]MYC03244.1 sugar phosphate isomerase/epimerase [Rhodothermaceae bacterium]MYG69804.1 sugar phosphate isomerase/epimerase [Rhodothermaceae bacterium]
MRTSRRNFLKTSALAAAALPLSTRVWGSPRKELFKISLAQWSLHRSIFAEKIDNLDFASVAAENGILGLEYVNQFFMEKAEDTDYLNEMKKRAEDVGATSILIMCDREGNLGDPDAKLRRESVERHFKWVTAAKHLGCHSIRVNGYSKGSYDEQMKLVADGLHQLCEFGDEHGLHVIIENHGGYSSNGKWLAGTIEMADHPRAGTLPDFGNFRVDRETTYDSYRGVEELMPYATGVSVKPNVYDDDGNSSPLDYERMMRIVLAAGYHGYCGIEHGPEDREIEGILEVKAALEAAHETLAAEME